MKKISIFGNSSSGKSSLAKKLSENEKLTHLDLDTLAWLPTTPPSRTPLNDVLKELKSFLNLNESWVIEGCYSDLLEELLPYASEVLFIHATTDQCIKNAKSRPWEPHKYKNKEEQDTNLAMLISWIKEYPKRDDVMSLKAHEELYQKFEGKKSVLRDNESINKMYIPNE